MKIRNRLLILLLGMALLPLLGTALLYQGSIRWMRYNLSSHTRDSLDKSARQTLLALLESNTQTFLRDGQLAVSALMRQAAEVERRLDPNYVSRFTAQNSYGFTPTLNKLDSPEIFPSIEFDYQRQRCYVLQGTDPNDIQGERQRLEDMTAVYHSIYKNGPRGTLWLYTSLEKGLHTGYPAADRPTLDPNTFDPRDRDWYQNTVKTKDIERTPIIDLATGQAVVTISMPVRDPNGQIVGVTAIDRTIHDILQDFALPADFDEGVKKFIVTYDPQLSAQQQNLNIVIPHDVNQDQSLHADEPNHTRLVIEDLILEKANARQITYEERDTLWVYQDLHIPGLGVVLIIPYTQIHDLAIEEETILNQEVIRWLEIAALGFVAACVIAIILAFKRSKQITEPILELTTAGQQLAEGNYDVSVNITTGDELQRLGTIFNQTGPALRERAQIKQSLELAGAIQQNLLPQAPPLMQGLDIAARCLYCDETGGDYYDFIDYRNGQPGKVGLALGDVTGHGIGAALLMSAVRSVLHAESRHCGDDLVKLFTAMNNQIARDTEEDKFVTFFYGLLNETDRSLTWASAGHDPAIHYQSADQTIIEHPNTGMLMGLIEDVPYQQAGPITLNQDDILLIGTDGIWEAQNPQGEYYGKNRLFDLIRTNTHLTADQLCDHIITQVTDFIAPGHRMDDITLIIVKSV